MSGTLSGDLIPFFAPGFRLKLDTIREEWIVLGPERVFIPDQPALAVLQLLDGKRTLDAVIAELAGKFDAPAAEIGGDVREMIVNLAQSGALRW